MKKWAILLLALAILFIPLVSSSAGGTSQVYLPMVSGGTTRTSTPTSSRTPTPTATSTSTATVTPTPGGENLITLLGTSIHFSGNGVTISGTTATITAGGVYRATGNLADGMIVVNTTAAVTLTLDGVSITHASGPAISVTNAEKLNLVLADGTSNTLVDGAAYTDISLKGTLFSNDSLEISGGGALFISGRYKHGIASDGDLIISSGNISVLSAVTDGFHANNDITINGGNITTSQIGSDGLESEGTFHVTAGTLDLVVADDGLIGANTVTIDGGTIQVTGGVEGIESKNNLIINAGTISIEVSDDGLNATNDITINGGQIYTNGASDAIDSNGTLNFTGGVTIAIGGNSPEAGLDCDFCAIAFDGGTVLATGGSNSAPSTDSAQYIAIFKFDLPAGTELRIAGPADADVLTFKIDKYAQELVLSSPLMSGSTTYNVITEGTISGGTNFHGLYTGSTYSGGTVIATFTTNSKVTNVAR